MYKKITFGNGFYAFKLSFEPNFPSKILNEISTIRYHMANVTNINRYNNEQYK